MSPNQKIFVYGSAALLALSFLSGSLYGDVASASNPPTVAAEAAPAEAAPAPVKAAEIEVPVRVAAATKAAPKAQAPAPVAVKASEPVAAAPSKAAPEKVAAAAKGAAPKDAADADCPKGKKDCPKGKTDCKKGKTDCDKSRGDCDKAEGRCRIGALVHSLNGSLDLSDEQVGRIDGIVAGYRSGSRARKAAKKQLGQDLRALWEASPIDAAAIQKKDSALSATRAESHTALLTAKLAIAAVLQPGQYDQVDHLFAASAKGKGKGKASACSHHGGKGSDCKGGSCPRG